MLLPLAVVGGLRYENLTYGLLGDLPHDAPSRKGTRTLQEHFPAGTAGPGTLLLNAPAVNFSSDRGVYLVEQLTERLWSRRDELRIADIRSVAYPLGIKEHRDQSSEPDALMRLLPDLARRLSDAADFPFMTDKPQPIPQEQLGDDQPETTALAAGIFLEGLAELVRGAEPSEPIRKELAALADRSLHRAAAIRRSIEEYSSAIDSPEDDPAGVTKLTLVFQLDPFSRRAIRNLDDVEQAIQSELPTALKDAEVYLLGPTASLRDLKDVSTRDRRTVKPLTAAVVLLVLIVVLRKFGVSVYLILTVLYGFLTTYGATYLLFRFLQGDESTGLHWTVPLFLFVLLVAVGADYNVLLVSRTDEEQDRHGSIEGVAVALHRTAAVISGCGIVMAGTFSSLFFVGTLDGLRQLGFALTFGVLLDTFVIRPLLVPAFLILLHGGKFGRLGRFLGTKQHAP